MANMAILTSFPLNMTALCHFSPKTSFIGVITHLFLGHQVGKFHHKNKPQVRIPIKLLSLTIRYHYNSTTWLQDPLRNSLEQT
jgi:hypothetical protein